MAFDKQREARGGNGYGVMRTQIANLEKSVEDIDRSWHKWRDDHNITTAVAHDRLAKLEERVAHLRDEIERLRP
jgi:hypothetical protein